MVRSKEILICNPRPNPCIPCLNPRNPSLKRKKRRTNTSASKNSNLLEMVKFLHTKLGNVNLSPEDREYIDVKLRLILNKISNSSYLSA